MTYVPPSVYLLQLELVKETALQTTAAFIRKTVHSRDPYSVKQAAHYSSFMN